MRGNWLGLVLFAVCSLIAIDCAAGELKGRLERVDMETVTLRDANDEVLVVRVDNSHRRQAAPFIGRWVTVDFSTDRGQCRALGFRAPNSR